MLHPWILATCFKCERPSCLYVILLICLSIHLPFCLLVCCYASSWHMKCGYSAELDPLVPWLKLSKKRTVCFSRGTVVPPDYMKMTNIDVSLLKLSIYLSIYLFIYLSITHLCIYSILLLLQIIHKLSVLFTSYYILNSCHPALQIDRLGKEFLVYMHPSR